MVKEAVGIEKLDVSSRPLHVNIEPPFIMKKKYIIIKRKKKLTIV